ncbi:MAG: NADAR family protein [Paludibacteraceae bacterium]|nr:NADAR family protein [Paludibacteraceae bacterium]
MRLHEAIAKYYPEYSDIRHYPAPQCAPIRSTREEWGIFGNFYKTDLLIDGVTIDCSERLFHLMKFRPDAAEGIRREFAQPCGMGIKMHMKSLMKQHPEWLRSEEEWGAMVVDAMRFCLQTKFDQCKAFREALAQSEGLFIVEDETARRKDADSWGTTLREAEYVGPNLLGRLLMELRDNNGKLDYSLPADALDFIRVVKS